MKYQYFKYLLSTLLFFASNINAQCTEFNVNFSFKDPFTNLTEPINCKNGEKIVAFWFFDSMALNSNTPVGKKPSDDHHCLIVKFNSDGSIKHQTKVNHYLPWQNVNLTIDSNENIYFPLITYDKSNYEINDTLNLATQNSSIVGFVKISSDFKTIKHIKIGKTSEGLYTGHLNLVVAFPENKAVVTLSIDNPVYLVNGDSLKSKAASSFYILNLDENFKIIKSTLLAESPKSMLNCGLSYVNNKQLAIIQYIDTIYFTPIKKKRIALIKAILNFPPEYEGIDYAILDIQNTQLQNTYNIGCTGEVRLLGYNTKIEYHNDRYLIPIINSGNGIYDNNNERSDNALAIDLNTIVVFDTDFNLVKYLPIESTVSGGYSSINLFKTSEQKLALGIVANKWHYFQNKLYSVSDTSKNTERIVTLFEFKNDAFIQMKQFINSEFTFKAFDYTSKNLFCFLYKTNENGSNKIWNTNLNKNTFPNSLWIANFCGGVLNSETFSKAITEEFTVYPNPSNAGSEVTLKTNYPNFVNREVNVYDFTGNILSTHTLSPFQKQLKLKIEYPGTYIIKPSGSEKSIKWLVK
jgi:hypothetical protein